ncbi:hypothetical protein PR202_gb17023 [Eleusine coracana subsp. coracana]|uniref:Protein MIZU-KUSSEI 1 n=1 Tax=Eleusine coracana subsp. coracana TaxID=191504 RepID=A0AAV5F1X4_ELECO|nr:hypothetical protein QOZ80_6BG0471980 [Eleusine coracana subsp. coracana]GJN28851.1 hypothetical protein PR202_gb17023 [Eleusine coracana subsp. coracana]
MARAFHAAVAALASPLPSYKNAAAAGGGVVNLRWLLKKRKVRHGRQQPSLGPQEELADVVVVDDDDEGASMFGGGTPYSTPYHATATPSYNAADRKRGGGEALTRLRSALLAVLARAWRGKRGPLGSCTCVTGTIFGRRRGRVHVALQADPRAPPALMLELAAYSTGALVKEMASGLVRLALECERTTTPQQPAVHDKKQGRRPALVEEATWRAYCNGRKCGYAVRRDCGAEEWRVLRAVEPVSVGAGVIPEDDDTGGIASDGDMMYMRAKFERVVGSRDSEAFYMVNPDDGGSGGGPELSIYLLRV